MVSRVWGFGVGFDCVGVCGVSRGFFLVGVWFLCGLLSGRVLWHSCVCAVGMRFCFLGNFLCVVCGIILWAFGAVFFRVGRMFAWCW